ncbi:Vesicular glutamate transporter 3 [Chionoecetes opilio]|uniref:Vesicular glutamate transporter 3 n=1 Tax=Chionoecetes opilio TaxID=41210 RepID=A0A8J4XVC1_CHIOP|nr:Vesicular glutamate transporter 3 [Chionoecetes opilio]
MFRVHKLTFTRVLCEKEHEVTFHCDFQMANLQEDSKNPDSRPIPTTEDHNTDLHKEKAETQDTRGSRGCRGWGARHTVVVLATLGIVIDYMLQTVLAVTIVAMVGQNTTREEVEGDVCPLPVGHNITEEIRAGVFGWDERTQGMIQGSIYYGCAIVSLPAGRVAETYGATRVFGAMVAVGCLLCLVSPVAAQASTSLFVALRVMQGAAVVSDGLIKLLGK